METTQQSARAVLQKGSCFVLAAISTVSLPFFFNINASLAAFSNSVFSVVCFVAFYFLFRKTVGQTPKRLAVISVLVGFLFALFTYVGLNMTKSDSAGIYTGKALLILFSEIPLFSAAVAFLLSACTRLDLTVPEKAMKSSYGGKKDFFIAWGLIFLAWIPILIASYPGIYGYDSVYQMVHYQSGRISVVYPLIHTYMLGFFVDTLGMHMLGSYEIGMLFYSLFQMLCMAAVFAYIFAYMRKRCLSPPITYVALAIFMFLPTNPIMAISSTKDVLYAALFAMMVAYACRVAEDETVLKKPGFLIAFCAVSFGQIIFRSQGKYVYVFMMIVLLIAFRRQWKPLVIAFLSTVLVFGIYSGPVTAALHGVTEEGRSLQEMMSVPCVQLSRAALKNADELTEEQLQLIETYVPNYRKYYETPAISDRVKRQFNAERLREHPGEFIRLWVSVGIKCPQAYIDAWAKLSAGLWYPDAHYPNPEAYHPYWEYDNTPKTFVDEGYVVPDRTTPSGMQWLADFCRDLSYKNTYTDVPVVSMLFSSGLPFWLLILYSAYFIYVRKYRFLAPALVLLALWGTMLLGPVVLYRYIYPLVMSIPVLFATFAANRKAADKTHIEQEKK